MRNCAVLVLAAGLAGCNAAADIWGPSTPPYATRFTPDTSYLRMWKEVETCSGKRGRMDRVTWYVALGDTLAVSKGSLGRWYWPHDIYLAERVKHDPIAVRHEILHDLLRSGKHPVEYFERRCGDLVVY